MEQSVIGWSHLKLSMLKLCPTLPSDRFRGLGWLRLLLRRTSIGHLAGLVKSPTYAIILFSHYDDKGSAPGGAPLVVTISSA